MDMDNTVVIAGGEGGMRGLNGNAKSTIKIKFLKKGNLGRGGNKVIFPIANMTT